jgi:hypothetical protein
MCPHCKAKDAKTVKRRYPDGRFDWMCSACGRQVEEAGAGAIVLYDKMVLAIDECHKTDEVKDIRDRALALQHCARIAKNMEAERKAAEIRIRAERRTGELLKELEKGKGGRPKNNTLHDANNSFENYPHDVGSLFSQAKKEADISDNQAEKWQKLADILKEEFEEALSDPEVKPSTSGLIEKPPSFLKPVIDIPQPKKLDNNPRRCRATCCPAGSEITGPWGRHDAQFFLDGKGFSFGYFGKDHEKVLDVLVEVDQRHLLAQFSGGLPRSGIVRERKARFKGIGQGRARS